MSVRTTLGLVLVGTIIIAATLPARSAAPSAASLDQAFVILQAADFIDLTHEFGPDSPHWKGFAPETVTTLFTIAKDGFHAESFCHPGQWGTHVDPPAHFHDGLKTVDQIDPKQFLLRLVVLDIHDRVATNPDYVVTLNDVNRWEARHGVIPAGAFVALRTDWSKRWPDAAAMQNTDAKGVSHYPGWSKEVLQYLYENRKITASGHETTDTDPGVAVTKDDYSLESYVLGTNHFQIELLTNLDKLPEAGALVPKRQ
jgi:kynurenine formamidase